MRSLANTTMQRSPTVQLLTNRQYTTSITDANFGREHWPFCYFGLLAGGGIRGGMTYVTSDAHGVHPDSDPVTPLDFGTSTIDALGIPIGSVVPDREGRPHAITCGKTIDALFV